MEIQGVRLHKLSSLGGKKIFRNSKMINLIKEPILENPNLKNVPKVLVLHHCRGMEHIDIESSSDSECEIDGVVNDHSHRMVSNLTCDSQVL